MIIQIKMDIKHNDAIKKYLKPYIAVIIWVNNFFFFLLFLKRFWICHHFLSPAYSIMYLELVGPAYVRNNGSDHPNAIIEYDYGIRMIRPRVFGVLTCLLKINYSCLH